MKRKTVVAVIALVGFLGCAAAPNDEEMYSLGAALTKLSTSVEGVVRYEDVGHALTDQELLRVTTEHDPALLRPFAGYALRARVENRHAVVLVCTKDKTRALLEDAGCSGKLDAHHWKEPRSCDFTVNVQAACSR